MRDFDYIVCGNNIGAMAAAAALGKRQKVAVVNPTPNWGGIFAGININGKQFDAGMAFLEFSSFYPQCENLSSYAPAVYNDSARFLNQVWEFFAQRLQLTGVGKLKTFLNGVFYEDIFIANQLQIMSSFCGAQKQKIIAELEAAQQRSELHATNKKTRPDLFVSANYRDVSVANHGRALHELLFAPLCRKIFNISAEEIPALYHRAAWCPLYYPETLLAAARGKTTALPKTEFHYPKAGSFSKTAETLAAEMRQTKGVTIVQDKPVGIMDAESPGLHLSNGEKITAKKIIWCGDLPRLCALSGVEIKPFEMQKTSMVMAFAETKKENVAADFSTAFVCDSGTCVYRVTNQNAAHPELKTNKFIFEMNADVLRQNGICEDKDIIGHVRDFSAKAEIFNTVPDGEQWTVRIFNNALMMPIADNHKKFDRLQETTRFRNIDCVGAAAGFAGGSFNDQIVGALQLGEKYGSD